ncbi:MAG TPA: FAD-binding oxidoreductase [Bacillota bacterium]|nr:FAD-binding oxidoreductase [Bacillota bacterium]
MNEKADLIIVGGGVIGSSIAYNLLNDGYEGEIIVFEKDRLYEYSSTPRSAGGIRQLFTTAINIEISRYSLHKYLTFPEDMAIDGEQATIDFRQHGYLFLAANKDNTALEKQAKLQRSLGVPAQMLSNEELLEIIPELNVNDLTGGLYCHEDGYLDPYSVMQGYANKAKELGAKYIYEEVSTITTSQGNVSGVQTSQDKLYKAPIIINCAGPWAPALSEKIGLPIPVIPLKRQVIQFDVEEPLKKQLPLTIDPSGVYFRHEGQSIISGYSEKIKPGIEFKWRRSFFEETLWPALANRVKNFERAKISSGWAGIYSHNEIDQNAIVGGHPALSGYYIACGFSGHGMQQAPAVGKSLAELIMTGNYETINLHPLRFERFAENDLVIEEAIV